MAARVQADFERAPISVEAARRFVEVASGDWHLEGISEIAQLLTSEVVTNAIVHASSAVRVGASWTPPSS